MHVVREGGVSSPRGWTPYRLVEVRSNDPSLPSEYRGKWVLAIDLLPSAKYRKTSPEGEQTDFHRSIVTWGNTGRGIPDDWKHASDLKVRPAEPAPTLQSDALRPRLDDIIERKMPESRFDGVGFRDAIDFLSDVMGVSIAVDWPRSGIDPNGPVNLDEKNLEFSKIIAKMLEHASGAAIDVDWAALQAAGVERDAPLHVRLKDIPVGQALCVIVGQAKTTKPIGITVRDDRQAVGPILQAAHE